MRYEVPAIEARIATKAMLGRISGGGGDLQPVWRSRMRYERPAIEARTRTNALLGQISGGGADSAGTQPVWRSRMRYERPAIEARIATNALLGSPQISGTIQPVWRSADSKTD